MARSVTVRAGVLMLKDREIEGFLERRVTPIGNSGKVDVPKRYIGRRAYVIVTRRAIKRKS